MTKSIEQKAQEYAGEDMWISVDDAEPCDSKDFIIFLETGLITGPFNTDSCGDSCKPRMLGLNKLLTPKATHWQYMSVPVDE